MSAPYNGDANLEAAVSRWLELDKNPITSQEVLNHISAERWEELQKTMLSRMKFGTAGLRGRMAAGFNCMNDVVVLQTAKGIHTYLLTRCSMDQLKNGIVIGYDGRHNSKRFAELTARVFVSNEVPVHIFTTVCPTPLVSFTTIKHKAAVGVMVTASHNPKEDNGYKVYWSNGSQIIAPHDQSILESIKQSERIELSHWDIKDIHSHPLVHDCTWEATAAYVDYIRDTLHPTVLDENKKACIKTVYSAMHGVGHRYVLKAFRVAHLRTPRSVAEQEDPNPEFPTVKFPNPEEPECLKLSQELAEKKEISLVLVNDPDADRLAVAEYDKSAKTWKVFTGNEMGTLLGWWVLRLVALREPALAAEDVYVLASIVSSKMLRAVVKGRGEFVETLTGFKWMGNTALLLQQQNKHPVFAFEEAIGYMCDPRVPDKDGISAAVHVASLASHLYPKGSSLKQQLQDLYTEYGYHVSHNSYYICHDPNTIQKIFRRIRNYHGPGEYPKQVGSSVIEYVKDFTAGVELPQSENAHLSVLGTGLDQDYTHGEMVMFRTLGALAVTIRTSGTEPKLKYYTELVCKADTPSQQENMKTKLKEMVKEFIDELLQPEENGLISQS